MYPERNGITSNDAMLYVDFHNAVKEVEQEQKEKARKRAERKQD